VRHFAGSALLAFSAVSPYGISKTDCAHWGLEIARHAKTVKVCGPQIVFPCPTAYGTRFY
jgi:hypothetical protein